MMKYQAIDSNESQKSSRGGTKVCEKKHFGIVFTAHWYLSQLLEPNSSNLGDGLKPARS